MKEIKLSGLWLIAEPLIADRLWEWKIWVRVAEREDMWIVSKQWLIPYMSFVKNEAEEVMRIYLSWAQSPGLLLPCRLIPHDGLRSRAAWSVKFEDLMELSVIASLDPLMSPATLVSGILKVKVKSLSHIPLFATPWAVACEAPPSMEFSKQEYWSAISFSKGSSQTMQPSMGLHRVGHDWSNLAAAAAAAA